MQHSARQRNSFVLRIWREGTNQAWKGWVQHASSGRAAAVNSPEQLLAFIEQHSNAAALDAGHNEETHDAGEMLRCVQHDSKEKQGSGLK